MNALNSRQLSPLLAIACRSTGAIMIVATLVSMIVLPLPYEFQNREWLLFRFVTPIVDRGIISLLGIVLVLGSCWIDSITRDNQTNTGKTSPLPLVSFSTSGFFAALFGILLILHLWNLFQWRTEQINSVAAQAAEAETQLTQQVDQQKEMINTLLENTGLRQEAIAQGQIPGEVVALLEQLDDNPENLTTFEDQIKEGLSDRQQEIGLRRQQLQEEVANRALKSGLMTGLDSLLLTFGFGLVAGTGFILTK
ncbi:MAG: HpsJ family protein [Cyanobacteria bacterium P01_F01_bin.150]